MIADSSNNFSNAWEVMGDTSLKTTLLIHFFFLVKMAERCELLVFLSFINMLLKSFLPLISFRVLSACPLSDFLLIYLLAHFFVLYICLRLSAAPSLMHGVWRGSVPTRWVYWIKGNSCQVISAIRERKWWAVNIMHACISFASVRFESVMFGCCKHYWWAFWIISPLKATYKTLKHQQFFLYIFVNF